MRSTFCHQLQAGKAAARAVVLAVSWLLPPVSAGLAVCWHLLGHKAVPSSAEEAHGPSGVTAEQISRC